MSSVCPSVCNVGGLLSHRLEILETNCTDNLAQCLRSLERKGNPPTPRGTSGYVASHLGRLSLLPSVEWYNEYQHSGWVIINNNDNNNNNGDGGCSVLTAYRRACGSSRLAWSKGRQPLGRCFASIAWTGWTVAMTKSWWQHYKHCPRYYYYYYSPSYNTWAYHPFMYTTNKKIGKV